jgi:alpha-beta hydrolase superfamily lysophospholipase
MIMSRLLLRAGVGLAGAALSYWTGLYFNQRTLVFKPVNEFPLDGVAIPVGSAPAAHCRDRVRVNHSWMSSDFDRCRLEVLSVEPQEPVRDVVLYLGGRSEDIRWLPELAGHNPEMAFFAHNYRGFGQSDGKASEADTVRDAVQLLDLLLHEYAHARVHVVGRSLGTGVAMQAVVARPQVNSLHLITPYDSIVNIAREKFPLAPVSSILQHRFESLRFASQIQVPTQIIMAAQDDVIPHHSTQRLIAAFASELNVHVIDEADHSSVVSDPRTWAVVSSFIGMSASLAQVS